MNVLHGIAQLAQAACSEFMPSFYLGPRIIEINFQRSTHKIGLSLELDLQKTLCDQTKALFLKSFHKV